MASMATLALKSGLYCLRFLFNFLLLFILFILGAELYLNNLSSFRGPPQTCREYFKISVVRGKEIDEISIVSNNKVV
jgi:hypothetical protein